jgi:hypothetical protein
MSGCNQKSRTNASGDLIPSSIGFSRRSKLEDAISELEKELTAVAARLEERGLDRSQLAELQASYTDITIALEALIKEWQEDK